VRSYDSRLCDIRSDSGFVVGDDCGRDKTENLNIDSLSAPSGAGIERRRIQMLIVQLMQLMLVLFGLVLVVEMISAILIAVRVMKPAGKNKCKNDEWENDSPGYE
jgi:hypothetical protein